jgi:hypothetical protein
MTMPLTIRQCEEAIAAMAPKEEVCFLATLGHWLTVVARGTYEIQAPGVADPIALRAFNELHHRLYAQIRRLASTGERNLDVEDIASWLLGEEQSAEFQSGCLWAFEQALQQVRRDAS